MAQKEKRKRGVRDRMVEGRGAMQRKGERRESSDKLLSREAIRWTLLLSLKTGRRRTKSENRKRAVLSLMSLIMDLLAAVVLCSPARTTPKHTHTNKHTKPHAFLY